MNKREKEVIKQQLAQEKRTLQQLERQYNAARTTVNAQIAMLQAKEQTTSRQNRIAYQMQVKEQLEATIAKLHGETYQTIEQFANDCYKTGYVGTMYDLHGQGLPVIVPIDNNAAIKAVMTDTKLKAGVYKELGKDMATLKKRISNELTRGIASNMAYDDIARNIKMATGAPLSRAKAIVRTEGHRIQQASQEDARQLAKSKGADVVKQWDATLDGATRPNHRKLDGQIRELNEPFEISNSLKAMYPGDFGDPAEDCNCRCVALTRARAALDADELATMKERAKTFKLDKTKDFLDFRKKYMKASETLEKTGESGIIEIDELTPCLRRMSDGELVKTSIVDVTPSREEFSDWEFDWTKPSKDGFSVRGIKVNGDDRIQGMVALKPVKRDLAVVVDIVEAAPFNNPHNKHFTEKEFTGVGGHLFAEAVRESYKQGFDGFVYFKAKSNLVEHYEQELGAVLVNPKERIMAIDERAAKKLYERYYKDE